MRISGKGLEGEAAGGTGGLKERVPEASRRKAPRRGGAGHPFILSRAVGAPVENARPKRRRRGILEALRRIDGGIPPDIRSTAPAPSAQDDGRRTGYRGTARGAKAGFPGPLHFQPDCLHVKLLSRLQTDARSSSVRKALFRPIFLRKNRALRTEVSTHPFQIVDQCFPIARQMPEAPL